MEALLDGGLFFDSSSRRRRRRLRACPQTGGLRVRVSLGANVPRRRPLADASSFISHPRTPAPGVPACAVADKRRGSSEYLLSSPRTRGPSDFAQRHWVPAFAGMTIKSELIRAFLEPGRLALRQAGDPSPAWPGGLRGEIKEEASAARRMPGDIRP